MKIEISSKNIEILPSISEYINEKFGSIEKHLKRFEELDELVLKTRVGRVTNHHKKGDVFEVSADISFPGGGARADKVGEDLRQVVDMVRDALVQEIEKHKPKHS